MDISLLVATFAMIVIGFGACLLSGRAAYRMEEKANYKFSNHFPYELLNAFGTKYAALGRILVIMTTLGILLFGYFGFAFPNLYQAIFVMVGFTLCGSLLATLFMTDMRYAKLHLLLASLYFVMVVFTAVAVCYFVITSPYTVYHQALAYIAGVVAVVEIVIALNPRLKRWETLEAVTQEDGTVSYERPQRFVLAYSEWLTTGLLLLLIASILLAALI
jgi:hypothetical protein